MVIIVAGHPVLAQRARAVKLLTIMAHPLRHDVCVHELGALGFFVPGLLPARVFFLPTRMHSSDANQNQKEHLRAGEVLRPHLTVEMLGFRV